MKKKVMAVHDDPTRRTEHVVEVTDKTPGPSLKSRLFGTPDKPQVVIRFADGYERAIATDKLYN